MTDSIVFMNHRVNLARRPDRDFLSAWWRIAARDPFWGPPPYHLMRRRLKQCDPTEYAFAYVEAYPRKSPGRDPLTTQQPSGVFWEIPLAAAGLHFHPELPEGAALLVMLRSANDRDSLEILFDKLLELCRHRRVRRLIGPVGMFPPLGMGIQLDRWNQSPGMFAPQFPPYFPELIAEMYPTPKPIAQGHIFRIHPATSPTRPVSAPQQRAALTDILSAQRERFGMHPLFPPPTLDSVFSLAHMLETWGGTTSMTANSGLVAVPELSSGMRRLRGGKGWWRRWALNALPRMASSTGHVPLVWGSGENGLEMLTDLTQECGWQSVMVGPIFDMHPWYESLSSAERVHTYELYEWEL